jgi:hypothetical protein
MRGTPEHRDLIVRRATSGVSSDTRRPRIFEKRGHFFWSACVLLVCQFPISDARSLVAAAPPRLAAPYWPAPQPNEFVRGFGPVKARRKGPDASFHDESHYVDARQAIKLPDLAHAALVPGRHGARCAFRRLHCGDSPVARIEVGFRLPPELNHGGRPGATHAALHANDIDDLRARTLDLPVQIHDLKAASTSVALHASGPALARLFLQATQPVGHADARPLVSSGAAALLIQYQEHDLDALPADVETIDPEITGGVQLAFVQRRHGDQRIGVWFLRQGVSETAQRNLRRTILRLHAEHHTLRAVLKLLTTGVLTAAHNGDENAPLQQYLNRATRVLPASYPRAAPERIISSMMHGHDDPIEADDRATIAAALGQARRQVAAKVDRFLTTSEQASVNTAPDARPIHVFVSYSRRDRDYVREDSDKSVLSYIATLVREGFVFWHDGELYASEIWDDRVKQEMARADIALILVSQPFLNSKYITQTELPALLAARKKVGLSILPLMVSASDWETQAWLAGTQFLPKKGTLIKEYRTRGKRDELYKEVLQSLRKIGADKRNGIV